MRETDGCRIVEQVMWRSTNCILEERWVEVGDVELGVSDRGMRSDGLDLWEMDGGEMDGGISGVGRARRRAAPAKTP